jgi:hypothetical protein
VYNQTMTNPTDRRAALLRAARLGALHGSLASVVTEPQTDRRVEEDFVDESRFADRMLADGGAADCWTVFRSAWLTAWERARCAHGFEPAHLTAPAARARA